MYELKTKFQIHKRGQFSYLKHNGMHICFDILMAIQITYLQSQTWQKSSNRFCCFYVHRVAQGIYGGHAGSRFGDSVISMFIEVPKAYMHAMYVSNMKAVKVYGFQICLQFIYILKRLVKSNTTLLNVF